MIHKLLLVAPKQMYRLGVILKNFIKNLNWKLYAVLVTSHVLSLIPRIRAPIVLHYFFTAEKCISITYLIITCSISCHTPKSKDFLIQCFQWKSIQRDRWIVFPRPFFNTVELSCFHSLFKYTNKSCIRQRQAQVFGICFMDFGPFLWT